jgi:multiple sugar transport system permease protein
MPASPWIMRSWNEAALIDGVGQIRMLLTIFIPVALPGIIAATIFAFAVSWDAFLYPIAFI